MNPKKIKPAVILDDDRDWSAGIARGIRSIGGLPVKHFFSIEAFCRHHKINYNDPKGLATALQDYSAVVCDNNFEGAEGEPGDGFLRGNDFLTTYAGPALLNIPANERPLVMSFAPSSESVIKKSEQDLWERFGINSFHKFWETSAIGLAVRIAREYGVSLNRDSVVSKICQQEMGDSAWGQPKAEFFMELKMDTEEGRFLGERLSQIEGDAQPMEWQEVTGWLSTRLNIPNEQVIRNIEGQVAQRRMELEGGGNPQSKK